MLEHRVRNGERHNGRPWDATRHQTFVLNTRSKYVQTNLEREGSYFQRMVHRDTADLERTIRTYVDGETEPVLGITDNTVVSATDPETAAVIAIAGTPVP